MAPGGGGGPDGTRARARGPGTGRPSWGQASGRIPRVAYGGSGSRLQEWLPSSACQVEPWELPFPRTHDAVPCTCWCYSSAPSPAGELVHGTGVGGDGCRVSVDICSSAAGGAGRDKGLHGAESAACPRACCPWCGVTESGARSVSPQGLREGAGLGRGTGEPRLARGPRPRAVKESALCFRPCLGHFSDA